MSIKAKAINRMDSRKLDSHGLAMLKWLIVAVAFVMSQSFVVASAQPFIISLKRSDDGNHDVQEDTTYGAFVTSHYVVCAASNRDEFDNDSEFKVFDCDETSISKDFDSIAWVSNAAAHNILDFNSFGSLSPGQRQNVASVTQQSDISGEVYAGTYLPNDPTLASAYSKIEGNSHSIMSYKPDPKFPNHPLNAYTIKVGYTLVIEEAWGTEFLAEGVIVKGSAHRVGGALLSFFQIRHKGGGVFVLEGLRYLNDRDDILFGDPEIDLIENFPVQVGTPLTFIARNTLWTQEEVRILTHATPFSKRFRPLIKILAKTIAVDVGGDQIILFGDDESGIKARVTLDIQLEDWLH